MSSPEAHKRGRVYVIPQEDVSVRATWPRRLGGGVSPFELGGGPETVDFRSSNHPKQVPS